MCLLVDIKVKLRKEKDKIWYLDSHGRSPAELFLDQSVVKISATDTLCSWNVMDQMILVLKAQNNLSHLVHAHHLITSNLTSIHKIALFIRLHEESHM